MVMHNRSRIFYIPGIISLLVLPVLCIYLLNHHQAFVDHRVVSVDMWSNQDCEYFGNCDVYPSKEYTRLTLSGNAGQDEAVLNETYLKAKRLIDEKDTLHGIHLVFSDHAKLGSYIKALDVQLRLREISGVAKGGEIWLFYNIPRPNPPAKDADYPRLGCGTEGLNDCVPVARFQEEESQRALSAGWLWPLIILFVALVILSFRRLLRRD